MDREMELFELSMRDPKEEDDSPLFVPRAISPQSTDPGSPRSPTSIMSGTTMQPMNPFSPIGGNSLQLPPKAAAPLQ